MENNNTARLAAILILAGRLDLASDVLRTDEP
jgi:hypothetical protein